MLPAHRLLRHCMAGFKAAIAITALALLTACASSPPMPELARGQQTQAIAHLQDYVRHEMDQAKTPGLSIAVVTDTQVLWAQGFGWADREHHVPATEHTLYRAGSLSKLFTTVAALQLADQGRLDIDAPVRRLLPLFAPQAPDGTAWPITPRMLMTHHSGLPRDVLRGFMTPHPQPFDDIAQTLTDLGADDRPDRVFSYSNVGMTVLGNVVTQVAHQPFDTWLQTAVLQPLGMTESAFEALPGPRLAQGYTKGVAATEPGLRDVPAGGLSTSVHDMARFLRMTLAQGQIDGRVVLSPAQVQAMFTVQNAHVPLDGGFQVGLGWMLGSLSLATPQGVGTVAHHSGATQLFSAQMYALPQQKLAVVVMANDQNARQLVDKVALRALALFLQTQAGVHRPPAREPDWASDADALAANQADAQTGLWPGDYATFVGPVRIVQTPGQAPVAQALGQHFTLRPRPDGSRSLTLKLAGLLPVPLGEMGQIQLTRTKLDGVDALVGQLGDQRMLLGSRVPPAPIPAAWLARVGRYRIVNQDDDVLPIRDLTLAIDGDRLHLRYQSLHDNDQPQDLLLQPVSDAEALVLNVLPDAGPALRWVASPSGWGLTFSGYVAIPVRD